MGFFRRGWRLRYLQRPPLPPTSPKELPNNEENHHLSNNSKHLLLHTRLVRAAASNHPNNAIPTNTCHYDSLPELARSQRLKESFSHVWEGGETRQLSGGG